MGIKIPSTDSTYEIDGALTVTGLITATGGVTGTASVATTVATAATTDATCSVALLESATGNQGIKSDAGLTYDATANVLTTNVTGTASVATTVTVADTTDTSCSVLLVEDATGNLAPKSDGGLTYNAGTGELNSTLFGANIFLKDNILLAVADTAGGGYNVASRGASGKILFTRGDAAQTIVFPAASSTFQDAFWTIISKTDQDITISFPANSCLTIGDAAATSIAYATVAENKIGARFTVYCDGSAWYAWGESPSLTLTIT